MERVRAEARHAAEVQGVVQIRRRKDQLARQVLLVVLQHQGNGADVHAVLEQVALQILQALEVLVELTRLTVAHEHYAVRALEDQSARGSVRDLAGNGVQLEPGGEPRDLSQDRKST